MVKKTIPSFWYAAETTTSPFMATAFRPLSYIYQALKFLNEATTRVKKSPLPIICIGNLTMGGAGKTPTARAIYDIVNAHGRFQTACFLMRGYGGKTKKATEIDPTLHTSWDVGDEALMQAQYAPTIISRDRYKGAMLAKKLGYDLIIMDDGFQNPQLKKDLSFIVIDGGFGFGNGHVFPSGPLRETVEIGVKRATASIIINRTDSIDTKRLGALKQFDAKIILENTSENQNNKKIIAFAGISRPEKFFNTLEENGYKLHAHYGFPDHKPYTHGQLKKLVSMAGKSKSTLMTTEKDWIRLSDKWRSQISYLKIRIDLGDNFTTYLNAQLDKLS